MSNLDEVFGKIIEPQKRGASTEERTFSPKSLSNIKGNENLDLIKAAAKISQNCPVSALLFSQIYLIWLVDSEGNFLFALEEYLHPAEDHVRFPKAKDAILQEGYAKLGHPALVSGAAARIAGELYFDADLTPPALVISNKSGRYGVNCGRELHHLKNVAKRLRNENITVLVQFI